MSVSAVVKAALAILSNEDTRRHLKNFAIGVVAILLIICSLLCCVGIGGAQHNNHTVAACFYGTAYSTDVPREFRTHIEDMRAAFSLLDSASTAANGWAEDGEVVDPLWVKSVFFALCFGEGVPTRHSAAEFVSCFYELETRSRTVEVEQEDGTVALVEEEYTVAVSIPQEESFRKLASYLGRTVTGDDEENISYIYHMVVGEAGGESDYSGEYERGNGNAVALDASAFVDPRSKNATDLVTYANHAWESGWGYVWGTYGTTLTEELLQHKIRQYPQGVGNYEAVIRAKWMDRPTADCVGLIKGYGWLDTETMTINYGSGTMPDIGANEMYYGASVSGTIDTIPETPGLAVWKNGHIGIYIGGGEVIEAMGTKYGVVKTQLEGRGWIHWLEINGISYR